MKILKSIVFFLFAPIVMGLATWIVLIYGKDKDTFGWYQIQWGKGGIIRKTFLSVISPIIFIPVFLLRIFYKPWQKLMED